jgi:hypothetical protein
VTGGVAFACAGSLDAYRIEVRSPVDGVNVSSTIDAVGTVRSTSKDYFVYSVSHSTESPSALWWISDIRVLSRDGWWYEKGRDFNALVMRDPERRLAS